MVSLQGVYPVFDYAFIDEVNCPITATTQCEYDDHSIMNYINTHHPRFAFIVKTARLDILFNDVSFRCTLFPPVEETVYNGTIHH